jgi:glycosyltransferase involved in cell wall biosynthesis
LENKFCFLYSGTLGLKHNPDLLLQLALHFKDNPQIVVFVGSAGLGAEWLSQRKTELALSNLLIEGYQPMDVFPQVLAAGDVLVGILEAEAGIYSVPSKVLSYMAAQKPLLLAVPAENLAARIVRDNQAGFVVNPASRVELIEKAQELFSRPLLRQTFANNARQYAEKNFDIEAITDRFEALIYA